MHAMDSILNISGSSLKSQNTINLFQNPVTILSWNLTSDQFVCELYIGIITTHHTAFCIGKHYLQWIQILFDVSMLPSLIWSIPWYHNTLYFFMFLKSESEWALLARYVYTWGIFYSDRDRTQTTKEQYTNIQIGNVQNGKNTIYNTDSYVWGLTCENLKWKHKYVWWINNCIIVLCVPCLI